VDSLRADHLPVYGDPHNTIPALTELSRDAWVFEHAYSQSSTTALSVPSMFFGRNPLALHYKRNGFPIAGSDELYLSKVFSGRGYLKAFITNDWVRDRLPGIRHGFEQVLASPPANWHSGDYLLESLNSLVEQAKDGGKPLFAVAHVDDVHHPYTAAKGRTVSGFPSPGEQAAYDRGIALFDEGLLAFIEGLKRQQLWVRTVPIVTADHGEEFGEHGGTIHSRSCYDEVTHVPLIVRIPGESAQRIKQPVALIDIAPTLLQNVPSFAPSIRS
jgi:arylsulfatase A-like enzyme